MGAGVLEMGSGVLPGAASGEGAGADPIGPGGGEGVGVPWSEIQGRRRWTVAYNFYSLA